MEFRFQSEGEGHHPEAVAATRVRAAINRSESGALGGLRQGQDGPLVRRITQNHTKGIELRYD